MESERRRVLSQEKAKEDPTNGHPYVEIGGVKWATTNIGAETETDYGLLFQWGDTAGYTSDQCGSNGIAYKKPFYYEDYKFNGGRTTFDATGFTKYNSSDGKAVLDPSDDAATLYWGGDWRMPTADEFLALRDATKFIDSNGTEITGNDKRISLSGVTGIYLQDKTDPNKRLFLPANGYGSNGAQHDRYYCYYWSSSLSTANNASKIESARSVYFTSYVSWINAQ